LGRAAGAGEPALVLPPSLRFDAPSRRALQMARNTHRLMVSSAKRLRRTMGSEENTREALEALADDRLRISRPAGQRDEAAVHVKG